RWTETDDRCRRAPPARTLASCDWRAFSALLGSSDRTVYGAAGHCIDLRWGYVAQVGPFRWFSRRTTLLCRERRRGRGFTIEHSAPRRRDEMVCCLRWKDSSHKIARANWRKMRAARIAIPRKMSELQSAGPAQWHIQGLMSRHLYRQIAWPPP